MNPSKKTDRAVTASITMVTKQQCVTNAGMNVMLKKTHSLAKLHTEQCLDLVK